MAMSNSVAFSTQHVAYIIIPNLKHSYTKTSVLFLPQEALFLLRG